MKQHDRPPSGAGGGSAGVAWPRLREGVEVAVALSDPQLLLGVRDGFVRYFHRGLSEPTPVAVVPQGDRFEAEPGIALSDEEAVQRARQRSEHLQELLADSYHFFVGVEGGIGFLGADGEERSFLRSWTVVRGLDQEAWGASGSLEIPASAIAGLQPGIAPGKKRKGGMVSELTGNVENRRQVVGDATFNALCSLFYGLLDGHPLRSL